MSSWDEKRESIEAATTSGRARANAKQIAMMWGAERFDPKRPPELIEVVDLSGVVSTWRKIAGSGPTTLFEREP